MPFYTGKPKDEFESALDLLKKWPDFITPKLSRILREKYDNGSDQEKLEVIEGLREATQVAVPQLKLKEAEYNKQRKDQEKEMFKDYSKQLREYERNEMGSMEFESNLSDVYQAFSVRLSFEHINSGFSKEECITQFLSDK